jgi:hypothetical protein
MVQHFAVSYSQEGLFTARQAQERGYSAQLLAHHSRTGRFTRVRRGLGRRGVRSLGRSLISLSGGSQSGGGKAIPS